MWQTKFGKCIACTPSGYKVFQNFGYRWLTFNSTALQTLINKRSPHKPALHYLPALTCMARQHPDSSCLLGLGGAGVAHMLSKKEPNLPILAVDHNEEVIAIAKQYFMLDKLNNLTTVCDAALHFVSSCNLSFKHLMIDLYNADHFPEECLSQDFFGHCYRILYQEGFLAINLANALEQWPILELLKNYFRSTLVVPVKKCSNMVIIACKNEGKKECIPYWINSKEFKKIQWLAPWGWIAY